MTAKTRAALKTDIDDNINTNGVGAITGAVHNTVLNDVADSAYMPQTDGDPLARANHTGTQALSTISDAGTAAAEDVGTSAGDVVQLDGSAKLPAVDGSQLTNLPPGGSVAIDDLTDVTISSPADNEVLAYDNGSSEFINQTAAEAGLAAASHNHAASDINSGTLAHERGGLEADVSAFGGLVQISGGATSAKTIGIADDNALEVDGTPNSGEFARFTANGLEGRTAAETRSDLNVEDGATADQSDAEIETAYNNQVSQVSAGEKTAGTETGVRRFSPKDVADMVGSHESSTPTMADLTDGDSWTAETSVASATTTDILGASSNIVEITGTTTITSLGTGTNKVRYVRFAAALTLTHNATSLILPGAANITTAAGDTMIVVSDGSSNARVMHYQVAADAPGGGGGGTAATQAEMEAASSTTAFSTPGRQHYHPGHPKCWGLATVAGGTPTLQSSRNITSVSDPGTGRITFTIATDFSSSNWPCLVTVERATTDFGDNSRARTGTIRDGSRAAGSIQFDCWYVPNSVGLVAADPDSWSMVGLGDQ